MEKRTVDKIKALQGSAANQEEFMKQLAGIDENGQLTDEFQVAVNGGAASTELGFGNGFLDPIGFPVTAGMMISPKFPDRSTPELA